MKKLLLLLLVAGIAAAVVWGIQRKNAPPEVRFTRVVRKPLVAALTTNGKVEPYEWQAVRAEASGLIHRVEVRNGQHIAKGGILAELTDPEVRSAIESAEARVAEAQANVQSLEAGGKPADHTDIQNSIDRARLTLQTEQKEFATLQRLVDKQAATQVELQAAGDKVRQTQLEIDGLEKRRGSLVSAPEVDAARARLREAEAALRLSRQHAADTAVSAPIAGEVYELAVRNGAYVNAGDLIANIGTLDRLRVRVNVDEPLLGRVKLGQSVTIKWEALPGKQWQGVVDLMPTSIQTLGSRQVGEVVCVIQNPGRDLIPGVNVDAEIRTAAVENALVIPKETLRRDPAGDFVFALRGDAIERRNVKMGVSSVIETEIISGLTDGDSVALPTDAPLKTGDRVKPLQ